MKPKPRNFNPADVLAIIAGTPVEFREVVKPQPSSGKMKMLSEYEGKYRGADYSVVGEGKLWHCPFALGQRIWVKEKWCSYREPTSAEASEMAALNKEFSGGKIKDISAVSFPASTGPVRFMYHADYGEWADNPDSDLHWNAARLMPVAAARLWLEPVAVRVEKFGGKWCWVVGVKKVEGKS